MMKKVNLTVYHNTASRRYAQEMRATMISVAMEMAAVEGVKGYAFVAWDGGDNYSSYDAGDLPAEVIPEYMRVILSRRVEEERG